MKNIRYAACIIAGLSGIYTASAQNEIDALRYSQISFGGTARYNAMGGAFGAVGADISTLASNPAGIGFFRRSELTFTPNFYGRTTTSTYNGQGAEDSRFGLQFQNFGLVFAGKPDNATEDGWQNIGLGIGYNRQQNFNSNQLMTGKNVGSMLDAWRESAAGFSIDELDGFNEGLAFQTWLMDTINGGTTYSDTIPDGLELLQRRSTETRGGMGEWDFTLGGNYANKVYVGATLGIPQIRYEEYNAYSETAVNDTAANFKYFEHNTSLETRGSGINFKFGLIYRPVDWLRVGAAFHSPTMLRLSDTYSADMVAKLGNDNHSYASPAGSYNYRIVTPMRAMGSVAFIIGKQGIISADYEFVDYSDARLRSSPQVFFDQNDAIRQKYTSAGNLRIGGEYRLQPFSFRAGFGMYGNPYATGITNEDIRTSISGGVGYRDPEDRFYFDMAFVQTTWSENYYFYSGANAVKNESKITNVMATAGFRF